MTFLKYFGAPEGLHLRDVPVSGLLYSFMKERIRVTGTGAQPAV